MKGVLGTSCSQVRIHHTPIHTTFGKINTPAEATSVSRESEVHWRALTSQSTIRSMRRLVRCYRVRCSDGLWVRCSDGLWTH